MCRPPLFVLAFCAVAAAQQPPLPLTLAAAEKLAIRNNPALASAQFIARAVAQGPAEARSALLPNAFGSVTAVGADDGSRIAAGALNNPVLYSRLGTGVTINQLVTDFGRTSNLVQSARFRADAENRYAQSVDANIIVQTDRAYYAILRAQSVLTVAQQTVAARQLLSDQVTELANNKLKSQLDVSFANVNLAQAKIQLSAANNDLSSATANLATVLGLPAQRAFILTEEPMPAALDSTDDSYLQQAVEKRPELAELRLQVNAAESTLQAEKALSHPSIAVIATAGFAPTGVPQVPSRYGAVGANLSIPIFNGGLFKARRTEAELRLEATRRNLQDLQNRVLRDVRVAWLNANSAFEQVGLTSQLLDQTRLALDLAQSRYDLGLSSIVELSQAQLNLTSAQIANAGARFDYQTEHSILEYEAGNLR
ncbi:MAG: TolC family protein [Acidobacteriota bacterium]|nr:TolC family protein [Acidobacteriota bacterium]